VSFLLFLPRPRLDLLLLRQVALSLLRVFGWGLLPPCCEPGRLRGVLHGRPQPLGLVERPLVRCFHLEARYLGAKHECLVDRTGCLQPRERGEDCEQRRRQRDPSQERATVLDLLVDLLAQLVAVDLWSLGHGQPGCTEAARSRPRRLPEPFPSSCTSRNRLRVDAGGSYSTVHAGIGALLRNTSDRWQRRI